MGRRRGWGRPRALRLQLQHAVGDDGCCLRHVGVMLALTRPVLERLAPSGEPRSREHDPSVLCIHLQLSLSLSSEQGFGENRGADDTAVATVLATGQRVLMALFSFYLFFHRPSLSSKQDRRSARNGTCGRSDANHHRVSEIDDCQITARLSRNPVVPAALNEARLAYLRTP